MGPWCQMRRWLLEWRDRILSHWEKGEWEDSDEISVGEDGNEYVARGLDGEVVTELNQAPTYEEVVKAIKGLKKGRVWVGIK